MSSIFHLCEFSYWAAQCPHLWKPPYEQPLDLSISLQVLFNVNLKKNMNIDIYIYMIYIYTHLFIHTNIYIYIYTYTFIHIHIYLYTYIYIYIYTYTHKLHMFHIFFECRFSSQVAAVALLTARILSKLLRRPLPKGPGVYGRGGGERWWFTVPMVWVNHWLVREIILCKMAELNYIFRL